MQDESNSKYSGLQELLNTENYLVNYNNSIVDHCVRKVPQPEVCIDFGAGIGTLSLLLKQKYGIEPIGVEIDEENLLYLTKRQLQHVKDINEVKSGVDLVFSSNVLEHIEDDVKILNIIKAKLNQNGYLFLYLPANMILWSDLDVTVGHYRRYSRAEIKEKLNALGFQIECIYYADSIGFFATLAMKLLGYNSEKGIGSPSSLKLYDKYIFPVSKLLDAVGFKWMLGKNVVAVAKKID
jgi:SAM-dependent methyltransferase